MHICYEKGHFLWSLFDFGKFKFGYITIFKGKDVIVTFVFGICKWLSCDFIKYLIIKNYQNNLNSNIIKVIFKLKG